jgi:hypothetical protein
MGNNLKKGLNEKARDRYSPEEWNELLEKRENKEICGSLNSEGRICLNPISMNGRCEIHCGTQRNIVHKQFDASKLEKVLPDNIMQIYADYVDTGFSDQSLSLEVKILSAKIIDFLKNAEESVNKKDFSTAFQTWMRLRKELAASQLEPNVVEMTRRFDAIFERAYNAALNWENLLHTVEAKRRVIETDSRREHYKGNYVHINEVMMIFSALANIVQDETLARVREFTIDEKVASELIKDISLRFNQAIASKK